MADNVDYICDVLVQQSDGTMQCANWIVYAPQSNFITELSQLTYAQNQQILSLTALLFATAWLMKRLSLTAARQ